MSCSRIDRPGVAETAATIAAKCSARRRAGVQRDIPPSRSSMCLKSVIQVSGMVTPALALNITRGTRTGIYVTTSGHAGEIAHDCDRYQTRLVRFFACTTVGVIIAALGTRVLESSRFFVYVLFHC
jgi:hypothetical protein